jgi:hypothetical protein
MSNMYLIVTFGSDISRRSLVGDYVSGPVRRTLPRVRVLRPIIKGAKIIRQENALTISDAMAPGMLVGRLGAERYRSCRGVLLQEREVPDL